MVKVLILCSSWFLDDSWHHRSFWIYGKGAGSGWGGWQKPGKFVPTGRLMVVKPDHTVYSFGRKPEFFAQAHIMEYMISPLKCLQRR